MSRFYHVYHPEQARAKWTVKNHLRRGKLVKPCICERCLQPYPREQIEGHHWSYKKEHHGDPIWLCKKCHRVIHDLLGSDWKDAETKPDYCLMRNVTPQFPPIEKLEDDEGLY